MKYATKSTPLIDWKDFVLHITKQSKGARCFSLDFVPDETSLECETTSSRQRRVPRKRKLTERESTHQEGYSPLRPSTSSPSARKSIYSGDTPHSSLSSPIASSSSYSSTSPQTTTMNIMDDEISSNIRSSTSSSIRQQDHSTLVTQSDYTRQIQLNDLQNYEQFAEPLQRTTSRRPGQPLLERENGYYPPPFRIQDPLVVDIDRITKTGIVATGKHRKDGRPGHPAQKSEHKILFWEYPSWRLIRELDLMFGPADASCQITGIQTIRMPSRNGKEYKVRLFSLAVGQPIQVHNAEDPDPEDRVDIWRTILVYRLFDNGATQCIAHLDLDGELLGREVFFFSEASWGRSNDGEVDVTEGPQETVQEWLKVVSPEHAQYDPYHTVFMLAIGPNLPRVSGSGQLIRFDIRGQRGILDPAIEPVYWDAQERRFRPLLTKPQEHTLQASPETAISQHSELGPPAAVVARIRLGKKVSCMIHFRYPPQLNHLICTGSYVRDELTVFDWRFGIKVGVLPWRHRKPTSSSASEQNGQTVQQQQETLRDAVMDEEGADDDMDQDDITDDDDEDDEDGDEEDIGDFEDVDLEDVADEENRPTVQPWGLESTMVLPPFWGKRSKPQMFWKEDFAERGLRLIAVGDNRSNVRIDSRDDKMEIKIWDISFLLRVDWKPLKKIETEERSQSPMVERDLSDRFSWWKRGTPLMRRLALRMVRKRLPPLEQLSSGRRARHYYHESVDLPYSPPKDFQPMILVHTFDCYNTDESVMPIKYTAYNVLHTSLFLLTEEGKIIVLDIESGEVVGTVENVAETPGIVGPQQQVRGIDVNVVGETEVVVTSRQGLLRGSMLLR